MPWVERLAIIIGVLLLVVLPTAVRGWPSTAGGNLFVALVLAAGIALTLWRVHPRVAAVLALGLLLAAAGLGGWFPGPALGIYSASFALLALGWSGRGAWLVALGSAAYVVLFSAVVDMNSWVAAFMFSLPPFVAGTVLRLRNEAGDILARRMQELEDERELYAAIAVRHERARIASELHDIVGHAISVMVIQAAAGQRLVDADLGRAKQTFSTISESARRGTQDLERLLALLGGSDGLGTDLSLVDEVVTRAGRSGLTVSCRFEGDRDTFPESVAQLTFRVVQEALTNVLRYAPGADVQILIAVDAHGRDCSVRVENLPAAHGTPTLTGTGSGLVGLRERVQTLGGQFTSGRTDAGGWSVEARFPGSGGTRGDHARST